jgi:lipopolysaccharide/colanic/teichoic acid biosynthesis glycosyltransferase
MPPARPTARDRAALRALLLTTVPGALPLTYPAPLGAGLTAVGCCALDDPAAPVAEVLARTGANLLIVLLSEHAAPPVPARILALHDLGVPVRILPWTPAVRGAGSGAGERYAAPLRPAAARLKRALDLLLAGAAIVPALPVMLIIALIIRRDSPGPALFRQHRIGQHGRLFEMYKFRTMRHAPEQAEAALRAAAPDTPPPPGAAYKLPYDPRITRVGRFLRRSSLDELPQLFNVLRGDMSLVGPRPELPGVMGRYAPWQLARLAVPPGMTGWWQVNGRSNHPMHLSTDDDLYYLAHYSLALDLRILVRTVLVVLRGTGAY